MPLLLLTSFAAVATAYAYADASVARVPLLTALKLLRSAIATVMLPLLLLHRVLLQLLLRTRCCYYACQDKLLPCHWYC